MTCAATCTESCTFISDRPEAKVGLCRADLFSQGADDMILNGGFGLLAELHPSVSAGARLKKLHEAVIKKQAKLAFMAITWRNS